MSHLLIIPILGQLLIATTFPQSESGVTKKKLTQVAELRTKTERLSHQLTKMRNSERDNLQNLTSQINQIEYQLRQEQIRNATLKQQESHRSNLLNKIQEKQNALSKPITEMAKILRNHINTSLPYQRKQRVLAIDTLVRKIAANDLAPATALSQLWQFIEDEKALTKEIALNQQVISVGKSTILVEVIHVGMSALYFRTSDSRFGRARQHESDYKFELLTDPTLTQAISTLYEALKNRKRTGYFPLALELVKGKTL